MTAGLLHTVTSLAATFDSLLDPGVRRIHIADPWLLETVRREGVTGQVRAAVAAHVRHLAASGAKAVLVTCSSIGEVAEQTDGAAGVAVLRVDAAMAAQAASLGASRIAVLATLPSTLGPTGRLVRRTAPPGTEVVTQLVEGAERAHDRGDRERVEELVAAAVARAAEGAGVIVLAQASMAGAAQRAQVSIPVLTSPPGAVGLLLDAL